MTQRANAIKAPRALLYNHLGLREILNVELENSRREGQRCLTKYFHIIV
jgi:hypothetical protein